MIRKFRNKNNEGTILIMRCLFGLGFSLSFVNAITDRNIKYKLHIDLLFIRFWCIVYE